jgi:hypothetical protein
LSLACETEMFFGTGEPVAGIWPATSCAKLAELPKIKLPASSESTGSERRSLDM